MLRSGERGRGSDGRRTAEPEDGADVPSLSDLLADFAEARGRARHEADEVPRLDSGRDTIVEAPRASFPVVGCLFRLVLLVLFLVALAALGLLLLFGGALDGF